MISEVNLHGLAIGYDCELGEDPYMAVHLSDSTPGVSPTVEIILVEVRDARTYVEEVRRERNCPRMDPWVWANGPGRDEVMDAIYDEEQIP